MAERRLLDLGGPYFREAILTLRNRGMKTEPAFASVLGLAGDPYVAMRALFAASDDQLADLIAHSARVSGAP